MSGYRYGTLVFAVDTQNFERSNMDIETNNDDEFTSTKGSAHLISIIKLNYLVSGMEAFLVKM